VNLGDNEWPYRLYKLRTAIRSLPDLEDRAKWNRKLDDFAKAFLKGRRFLMNWRLGRLEKKIMKAEKVSDQADPTDSD